MISSTLVLGAGESMPHNTGTLTSVLERVEVTVKVLNCPGANKVISVLVGICKPLHKPFDLVCGGHGQQTMVEDVRLLTPTEITVKFEAFETPTNEDEISRGGLVIEYESSAITTTAAAATKLTVDRFIVMGLGQSRVSWPNNQLRDAGSQP